MRSQSLSIEKRPSIPGGALISGSRQGEQGTHIGTVGAPKSPNAVRSFSGSTQGKVSELARDEEGIHTLRAALLSCSVVSDSLRPHGLQPTRLFCPWGFSRQEYWSGLPCPPPGDLSNPGLLHCRQILYRLSHQGSPRILEWLAYPFVRGSF